MRFLSLLLLVVFSGSISGNPVNSLGAIKHLLGRHSPVPEEHPPTLLTFFGEYKTPASTSPAPLTGTGIEKTTALAVPSKARQPLSVPPHFPSDLYEFIKHIGRGHYGQVYLAREKSSSRKIALKSIKGGLNQANREYNFLKDPVIDLAIPGSNPFRHEGISFIPMKQVSGTQWLSIENKLTRDQESTLIDRGIKKLKRMHQAGIIHGDAALRNIIVDLEKMDVVFVDFGRAWRVSSLLFDKRQREKAFQQDISMFLDEFF